MNSINGLNPFWILVVAAFLVGVAVIFGLMAGTIIFGIIMVSFIYKMIKMAIKGEIDNVWEVIAGLFLIGASGGLCYLCYWLFSLIISY